MIQGWESFHYSVCYNGDAGLGQFTLLSVLCGDAGLGKFTLLTVFLGA